MKGLCALKKERKEKVHSFTQRFATYLKNFFEIDKPLDKVLIEYYTSALGLELAMFAKMKAKPMLAETYEEAERVEAEKESIEDYPEQFGEKIVGRKALLFTESKEEQSPDFEGLAKIMQKLSNRIIDLEKEKEAQKFYKPYYKKGEAASCYFALPANSIPDWNNFERIFRNKYAAQRTHASLMKVLVC